MRVSKYTIPTQTLERGTISNLRVDVVMACVGVLGVDWIESCVFSVLATCGSSFRGAEAEASKEVFVGSGSSFADVAGATIFSVALFSVFSSSTLGLVC